MKLDVKLAARAAQAGLARHRRLARFAPVASLRFWGDHFARFGSLHCAQWEHVDESSLSGGFKGEYYVTDFGGGWSAIVHRKSNRWAWRLQQGGQVRMEPTETYATAEEAQAAAKSAHESSSEWKTDVASALKSLERRLGPDGFDAPDTSGSSVRASYRHWNNPWMTTNPSVEDDDGAEFSPQGRQEVKTIIEDTFRLRGIRDLDIQVWAEEKWWFGVEVSRPRTAAKWAKVAQSDEGPLHGAIFQSKVDKADFESGDNLKIVELDDVDPAVIFEGPNNRRIRMEADEFYALCGAGSLVRVASKAAQYVPATMRSIEHNGEIYEVTVKGTDGDFHVMIKHEGDVMLNKSFNERAQAEEAVMLMLDGYKSARTAQYAPVGTEFSLKGEVLKVEDVTELEGTHFYTLVDASGNKSEFTDQQLSELGARQMAPVSKAAAQIVYNLDAEVHVDAAYPLEPQALADDLKTALDCLRVPGVSHVHCDDSYAEIAEELGANPHLVGFVSAGVNADVEPDVAMEQALRSQIEAFLKERGFPVTTVELKPLERRSQTVNSLVAAARSGMPLAALVREFGRRGASAFRAARAEREFARNPVGECLARVAGRRVAEELGIRYEMQVGGGSKGVAPNGMGIEISYDARVVPSFAWLLTTDTGEFLMKGKAETEEQAKGEAEMAIPDAEAKLQKTEQTARLAVQALMGGTPDFVVTCLARVGANRELRAESFDRTRVAYVSLAMGTDGTAIVLDSFEV